MQTAGRYLHVNQTHKVQVLWVFTLGLVFFPLNATQTCISAAMKSNFLRDMFTEIIPKVQWFISKAIR